MTDHQDRRAPAWIAVLVKDFDLAKQRLRPALPPPERRRLAVENARRALLAARGAGRAIAICGSPAAAAEARALGVEAIVEASPAGQNPAAARAVAAALAGGAGEVLILSSDIPGVSGPALDAMIAAARDHPRVAVAAAALGRGGTNALFMRPPGVIGLHFGDDSLARFEADARLRGAAFVVLEGTPLALDLDEPTDLELLARP